MNNAIANFTREIFIDCQYYPICGGCDIANIDKPQYQIIKKRLLLEIFNHHKLLFDYDKISWQWLNINSRRRVNLHLDDNNNIGFFSKKTNKLIAINYCRIVNQEINNIINKLNIFLIKFPKNIIKNIVITSFDNIIDIIIYHQQDLNIKHRQLLIEFAKINNCNISANTLNKGKKLINNNIDLIFFSSHNQIFYQNLKIIANSNVFLQANQELNIIIANIINHFIDINFNNKKPNLIDLYCGFGNYSFMLANKCIKITAFEDREDMIEILNNNARSHNLKISGYVRDLNQQPLKNKELQEADLIIINPPRNGSISQVKNFVKSQLKEIKIIYISCNPSSFIIDAKIMIANGFKIHSLTAIDQFIGSNKFELLAIFI